MQRTWRAFTGPGPDTEAIYPSTSTMSRLRDRPLVRRPGNDVVETIIESSTSVHGTSSFGWWLVPNCYGSEKRISQNNGERGVGNTDVYVIGRLNYSHSDAL